jgi:DNA adenine methylase
VSVCPAPIPWFGGKSLLARRIAELLPPHRVYVEVFGGSGAVLFAKGRSHFEVWNDLDDGLVHFMRTLRDQPDELVRAVTLTPFARSEFRRCYATWRDADGVERARRWYVAIAQAFNASPPDAGSGAGWTGEYAGVSHVPSARAFASSAAQLERCAERFRGVQVDALDWRDVLARYDGPTACLYLDPPYVHATRSSSRGYAHELTDADHAELVARLPGLAACAVVVSGYDHPLYAPLADAGFERYTFPAVVRTAARGGRTRGKNAERIEVVWRRAEGTLF